jgi:hypothetical protein
MKVWLKALCSEALLSVWWILSAFSTLSTFFFKGWSGKPRLISAISTILGFAWANFRVFQKQQSAISHLRHVLAAHDARVSELRIVADEGSRYILAPVGDVRHADFRGGCFEFHLMIENTGRRDSTVDNYQVEIVELGQRLPNLRPMEGQNGVQGRHCYHNFHPARILSEARSIRIRGENATNYGVLLFFVPDLNLDQFAHAGLQMHGEERRFGPLHCRLTLTDTMQSSATAEFVLDEA